MLYFQNHYHLLYVSTQGIRANQKGHREKTEESQRGVQVTWVTFV